MFMCINEDHEEGTADDKQEAHWRYVRCFFFFILFFWGGGGRGGRGC